MVSKLNGVSPLDSFLPLNTLWVHYHESLSVHCSWAIAQLLLLLDSVHSIGDSVIRQAHYAYYAPSHILVCSVWVNCALSESEPPGTHCAWMCTLFRVLHSEGESEPFDPLCCRPAMNAARIGPHQIWLPHTERQATQAEQIFAPISWHPSSCLRQFRRGWVPHIQPTPAATNSFTEILLAGRNLLQIV